MSVSTPPQASSSSTPSSAPDSRPELPWSFYECPTETLVVLISHMLNLLIHHNDQVVLTPDSLTRFHSRAAPGITVVDYLQRIVKYTNMEKIPLLSLLAYIDVTCTNLPTFTLSSLTVHRFLIAGVCAGSKAQCDVFCTNSHYAKVGGIKVTELNGLEREFLKVTQWDLCCKAELLQRYYTSLIKSHGGYTQAAEPVDNILTTLPNPSHGPVESGKRTPESTGGDQADKGQSTSGPSNTSSVPPPSRWVDEPFSPNKRNRRGENPTAGMHVRPQPTSSRLPIHVDDYQPPSGPPFTSGSGSAPGDMEVDDQISPSSTSNGRISSSPASSSVPSSSRSSLRTRNVSMSQLAPSVSGAASPRVDMTQATGRVSMDVDPERPPSASSATFTGNGTTHNDTAVNINIEPTTAIPPAKAEQDATGRAAHHGPGGGAGGKLLKSLGGIFRWHDPAHHSDPPPSSSSSSTQQQQQSTTNATSTNDTNTKTNIAKTTISNGTTNNNSTRLVPPHQSPGRRVKSPLLGAFTQTGETPALAAPVTPRVRTRGETTGEC